MIINIFSEKMIIIIAIFTVLLISMIKTGDICNVLNILHISPNKFVFIVKKFLTVSNFYDIPYGISSSFVGIYKCSALSSTMMIADLSDIFAKCYKMPYWKNGELQEGQAMGMLFP